MVDPSNTRGNFYVGVIYIFFVFVNNFDPFGPHQEPSLREF
jgi:hypothetical protein